jgi:hypothetical protein
MKFDGPIPGPGTLSGTITITGITGRFTNYNDVLPISGRFDTALDYAIWTAEGTITY